MLTAAETEITTSSPIPGAKPVLQFVEPFQSPSPPTQLTVAPLEQQMATQTIKIDQQTYFITIVAPFVGLP